MPILSWYWSDLIQLFYINVQYCVFLELSTEALLIRESRLMSVDNINLCMVAPLILWINIP